MDPELQALREARLHELRSSQSGEKKPTGELIQQYMESEALARLSRVALVRPDRAQAVEAYLHEVLSRGAIRSKITEQQVVGILNNIAREEQKRRDTKIIFDRRETVEEEHVKSGDRDSEDEFFE